MNINILMPLGRDMYISQDVLDGIRLQNVNCILIIASNATAIKKEINEAENRNSLKSFMSARYTMYLDSDVVLTEPNDIEAMIHFLDCNAKIDAVAIDTKRDTNILLNEKINHVMISCMLIRNYALKHLTFRQISDETNECLCISVNKDIHIRYLPNRKAREVKNGK